MYKRAAAGWLKHLDFIFIDMISLQIAFMVSYVIRMQDTLLFVTEIYRNLDLILLLWNLITLVVFNTMHNVMKRGYGKELTATIKHCLITFAGGIVFVFTFQMGDVYSRIILFLTLGFHILLGYLLRSLWKRILLHIGPMNQRKSTMLAVLSCESADLMVQRILNTGKIESRDLVGVVLDHDDGRNEICGVPVVCSLEETSQYICRNYIDSLFLDFPAENPSIARLLKECRQMMIPIHYHIAGL